MYCISIQLCFHFLCGLADGSHVQYLCVCVSCALIKSKFIFFIWKNPCLDPVFSMLPLTWMVHKKWQRNDQAWKIKSIKVRREKFNMEKVIIIRLVLYNSIKNY